MTSLKGRVDELGSNPGGPCTTSENCLTGADEEARRRASERWVVVVLVELLVLLLWLVRRFRFWSRF